MIENTISHSIFVFVKIIQPECINLVHNSGKQDELFNEHEILYEQDLKNQANKLAEKIDLSPKFLVPKVGDEFEWI